MRIAIDAFGGDNAPSEVLKGCQMAVCEDFNEKIIVVGDKEKIFSSAKKNNINLNKLEIFHALDEISMEDAPQEIMRSKRQSSMAKGLELLAKGEADIFLSAGNSGALIVGSTFIVKRIKGVKRCAFAPIVPAYKTPFLLIDGGANIECTPSMIVQFGVMGSVYMKNVMKIKDPRVALLNIGVEECKGRSLHVEAFKTLKSSSLNFIGNIEARELSKSGADVVVTDGFTGNVVLKLYEGLASTFMKKTKDIFNKDFKNKFASSLLFSDFQKFKKEISQEEHGGAPILGVSKPIFKIHGNSAAKSFKSAINLAISYAKTDVIRKISDAVCTFCS
ncbi:MAG: phosphate acyltransferase PlsX [Oscillospiraceae bacterium]|jgi:glycerol-3-phosphate acyltransferase PlsX|nr:phosphate acyltransferase PlsX [Oscillospiraceae bacterium]